MTPTQEALKLAREALALPCDRWNAVQSKLVREALAAIDALPAESAAAVPDGWVLPIGPHDHPEPQVMVWSEIELRSIRAYAARCVAAMLAAAPQAPQQAEPWQPIETAPKDAVVLLAAEFDCPGDWRIKCGTWIPEEKAWRVWGASWIPTRWMPLPAPPATQVA